MGLNVYYEPDMGGAEGGATPEVPVQNDGSKPQDGNLNSKPGWMAQLPDDLKGNEQLSKFATMGEAFKSLMENQDKKAEAQPTEVKPIAYENFDKKLADSYDPLGEIGEGLKGIFQNKGISQKDAEDIFDAFSEVYGKAYENLLNKGKSLCEQRCKEQWGKDYETKRALMAKGYLAVGDSEFQKSLDDTGASCLPEVWELLARVGNLVSEDTKTSSNSQGGPTARSTVPIDYSKPSI